MQANTITIRQASQQEAKTISQEKLVAIACVTLLPFLYVVGKTLMIIFP